MPCRPSSSHPDTQFGLFGARVAWSNGLTLTTLAKPIRKLDTRQPGPLTGKIVPGQVKTVRLGPELIAGAKAALLNVTVTATESFGFLTLYDASQPPPATSTINWGASGETIANGATTGVTGGSLAVLGGGVAASKAHVIVDLVGYYS